jgi:hypothetical protein
LITEVVSLIVAVRVEQREFKGKDWRAKSRPGTAIGTPGCATPELAKLTLIVWYTVEDHSIARSTNTFSDGT